MALNKIRSNQIKDLDHVTEAELDNFDLVNNVFITEVNSTQIKVAATSDEPAALTVNGQLRYNTSDTDLLTISGPAGDYDIFAVGDSSEDKNFTLAFAADGQNPAGATSFRLIGEIEWDGSAIVSASSISDTAVYETQSPSTNGQQVFNLEDISYKVGSNNLSVYVNGIKQIKGVSYTETDSNTITFIGSDLTTDDDILFVVDQSKPTGGSSQASLPEGYIEGLVVEYVDASTIKINTGRARDNQNSANMDLTSSVNVTLTTNGKNGLDTGSESNDWYYVWLIKNSSTGEVTGLLSLSSTNPTMPSGFDKKRILPIAVKNHGSDIIPFAVGSGWPFMPSIEFLTGFGSATGGQTSVLSGASSTNYATVNCSPFIPNISRNAGFYIFINNSTNNTTREDSFIRESSNGQEFSFATKGTSSQFVNAAFNLRTTSGQNIEYKAANNGTNVSIWVTGFVVDNL